MSGRDASALTLGVAPQVSRDDIGRAYHQHGHAVLRRASMLMGDPEEALEVLHEVFLSLLDRPEQFAGKSSILTWLYSATTHRCLNALRDRRTRRRILAERQPVTALAAAPAGEHVADVLRVVGQLPREVAEAAVYYFLDDMTQQEIADVMGCSRRHVGHLITSAQEQVQAAIDNEQERHS